MTKLAVILLPIATLALAGCGDSAAEPEAPAPAETAEVVAPEEDSLPPADRDSFAAAFAAACPAAEPVNNASCQAMGMGSDSFLCEYGLGDDEYLRHKGVVSQGEDGYVLDDPETVCAQ